MQFNEVDVAIPSWYRGTVREVGSGSWCQIEYDDGDVFKDYFDNRPGSVVYQTLSRDAPIRKSDLPQELG